MSSVVLEFLQQPIEWPLWALTIFYVCTFLVLIIMLAIAYWLFTDTEVQDPARKDGGAR